MTIETSLTEPLGKLAVDGEGVPKDQDAEVDVEEDSGDEAVPEGGSTNTNSSGKKKKKKKPKKKKAASNPLLGNIPPEQPAPVPESDEDKIKWEAMLGPDAPLHEPPVTGLVEERNRPIVDLFLTPSCRSLELLTPRLRLRQIGYGDTTGIRKIKMEPIVQKTQLYGSPSFSDIKESFQTRYIRSCMPRIMPYGPASYREEYVFAITAKDPASGVISVGPPGQIKITNRINSTEGYLGNFALRLETKNGGPSLLPRPGQVYTQPTFTDTTEAQLFGKIFYEIHPQLWGQGLMSEAFTEVLRFAFEEVGCVAVEADPTSGNPASIKVCTKHGMRHTRTSTDNDYKKPQAYHEITKEEWWKLNRPGREIKDHWGGKEVCRWCLNFRLAPPTIKCTGCEWAKYCSRECQRADWICKRGHREECAKA